MWNILGFMILIGKILPKARFTQNLLSIFGASSLSGLFGFMNQQAIFAITIVLISFIGLVGIFHKANVPIWAAFIPGYNIYKFYELAGAKHILITKIILILLMSFVNNNIVYAISSIIYIICDIILYVSLSEVFKRSGFMIFALIFFYPLALLFLGTWKTCKYSGPLT